MAKTNLKFVSCLLLCAVLIFHTSFIDAALFQSSCRAVIFSDTTKIRRLYGKGVHERVLPASTTKIMTALVVLERMPLDAYVTVNSKATYAQPSKIYARPGERYRVRDLLYATLLNSANDATIVLAEATAGSEANFVNLMNKRAKALGAIHTKFANSNGLPTRRGTQYTSAYDMYLIFREALKNRFFREAIKRPYGVIYSRDGRKIPLKSHNKILFSNWRRKVYGKTGYTNSAGACFVGMVEYKGSTLVIGVFDCPERWRDIKYVVSNYAGMDL